MTTCLQQLSFPFIKTYRNRFAHWRVEAHALLYRAAS
jgi:hypothetical protein